MHNSDRRPRRDRDRQDRRGRRLKRHCVPLQQQLLLQLQQQEQHLFPSLFSSFAYCNFLNTVRHFSDFCNRFN